MIGKGQNKKNERNQAILKDVDAGFYTAKDLAKKWGISRARVYAIVKSERLKDEVLPLVGDDNKN